jgi:glycosyltransferase involved in cell wall biosynthesis
MIKNLSHIPVLYIENKENSGPGASRNVGLSSATAQYISFLDSDDYLNENFVKIFKEELSKGNDFNIFVGSTLAIKEENSYMTIPPEIITWLHGRVYLLSFLRENEITFPEIRFNEDSGFNAIAHEVTQSVVFYKGDVPMYYWMHNNPESLTSLSTKKSYEYAIETYIQSIIFAYGKILKEHDAEELNRFPAQILQVYLFYCELLYRNETVLEVEKQLHIFFDLIHKTKWYQSKKIKDKIAEYVIMQNILGPVIPEITFAEFVKKFEKDPLNFR